MGPLFVYISFTIICIGALFRPKIGIIGYIGWVSLSPHWLWRFTLIDPRFEFQKYIAIATLVGFALSGFSGTKLNHMAKWALGGLVLYLAISWISAFQSINGAHSWFFMNAIYKIVIMAFIVVKLCDSRAALKIAALTIVAGVGWNAYEINMDYFRRGWSTVDMTGWAYMNSNGYALVVVLAAALTLVAVFTFRNQVARWLLLGVTVLDLHALYLLESRGAMLGMAISGVLVFAFVEKNWPNVALMLVLVSCAIALAGPSVVEEVSSSFAERLDHSAESRYYIWEAGVRIAADHPLLGVGPWAAEYLVPKYYEDPIGSSMTRIHLHNLPLEIATGSGIIALLAYLVFFALPIRTAFRIIRSPACEEDRFPRMICLAVVCGMPGYWFASFFNSGALVELPYILISLTIAAICLMYASEGADEDRVTAATECGTATAYERGGALVA